MPLLERSDREALGRWFGRRGGSRQASIALTPDRAVQCCMPFEFSLSLPWRRPKKTTPATNERWWEHWRRTSQQAFCGEETRIRIFVFVLRELQKVLQLKVSYLVLQVCVAHCPTPGGINRKISLKVSLKGCTLYTVQVMPRRHQPAMSVGVTKATARDCRGGT